MGPAAFHFSAETCEGHREPRRAGFTLLEVLAAVAILAIWYVVIAAMATDGLRKQGISSRLIEASEIANRVVAEIEASAASGSAPEIQDEATEEGDFRVHVFVSPMGFGVEDIDPEDASTELGAQGSPDLRKLLKVEMPGMSRHLRAVQVRVAWDEGAAVRKVRRSTYTFDLESAQKVYQSKEAREAEEKKKAESETDDDGAEGAEDFE